MSDDKLKPASGRKPFSPSLRQKRYWGALLIATVSGIASGLFLSTVAPGESSTTGFLGIFALAPISSSTAIIGSAVFAIMFILTITMQHKGVDEQEERAIFIANTASWYFILIAVPIWWLLSSANLILPIDGYFVFIASLVINAAVWIWKKYF